MIENQTSLVSVLREVIVVSPWILLHLLLPCHTGASREEHIAYQSRTVKLINGGQLYSTNILYIYAIY